ncbi:hypothetical protein BU15DRAFT_87784 [Melanogaster broomeanus]|nr:hypothetical protein BU15DRAFT_87784 [Melanogaster broomeanus]
MPVGASKTVSPFLLSDVKAIASYSWLKADTPTIAVPEMGDQSPMVPLFAAVDVLHDDFRYNDLDLITNRNSFRKLLRYIDNDRNLKDFRIDIDLVKDTCLFTRWEENPALAGSWSGYAPRGCETTTGHHLTLTLALAELRGLKVMLGFTVDACTPAESEVDDDLFLASLSSLSIRSGVDVRLTSPRSLIPQSNLIEVKTRSLQSALVWREIYPQLYFSQTAWLYVAWHSIGTFQPVEKIALDSDAMKPHAQQTAASIRKLKVLLEDILEVVRKQGPGIPLSLVGRGGTLTLWKRKEGTGKPLGVQITSRFNRATPPQS